MEDSRDIIATVDDADIIVDSPAEVYSSLSEAYASMRENQEAMRAVAQSISSSLQKIYECTKPVSLSVNKEALVSMTAGLSKFAEVSKAITAKLNAVGTASAMASLTMSLANSNTLAETIRNSSTLAMTESVRKSIEASSLALSNRFDMKGMTVPADQIKSVITANRAFTDSIPKWTTVNAPGFQSSITAAIPKAPSLSDSFKVGLTRFADISFKYLEWVRTSSVFQSLSNALSIFREYLQKNISPLFEKLREYKVDLKHFALRALLFLRKRWLSRRHRPLPLDEDSFQRALSLLPIGPATSFEFVEFADRIRHTYLQKHQRLSDVTDAPNDNYLLAC